MLQDRALCLLLRAVVVLVCDYTPTSVSVVTFLSPSVCEMVHPLPPSCKDSVIVFRDHLPSFGSFASIHL